MKKETLFLSLILVVFAFETELMAEDAASARASIGEVPLKTDMVESFHANRSNDIEATFDGLAIKASTVIPDQKNTIGEKAFENCINESRKLAESCLSEYGTSGKAAILPLIDMSRQLKSNENMSIIEKGNIANNAYKTSTGPLLIAQSQCLAKIKQCPAQCSARMAAFETDLKDTNQKAKVSEFFANVENQCEKQIQLTTKQIADDIGRAKSYAAMASKAADDIKSWALKGGAAVLGGIVLNDKKHDKEDRKRTKSIQADFENGIIRTSSGEKLNCLTQDNFTKSECRQAMFNYCAKTEHSGKVGCAAFNNNYCSSTDASQSYCLANIAKNYCTSGGSNVSQSPACQWVSSRDSTCAKEPENLNCLSSMTPAQLSSACPSYPNDPLCQSFRAGMVVSQPVAEEELAKTSQSGSTSSSSMSDLIQDSADDVNNSNQGDSIAAKSSTNLWSENSSALKIVCSRGQLKNCQ